MAHAEVEERQLLKAMTWWDGFVVALANPGFLIAALGGSIGALGTTGAFVLWTISITLGALQNNIHAELAGMFPQQVRRHRALRARGVAQVPRLHRPARHLRLLDRLVRRALDQRARGRHAHPGRVVRGLHLGRELGHVRPVAADRDRHRADHRRLGLQRLRRAPGGLVRLRDGRRSCSFRRSSSCSCRTSRATGRATTCSGTSGPTAASLWRSPGSTSCAGRRTGSRWWRASPPSTRTPSATRRAPSARPRCSPSVVYVLLPLGVGGTLGTAAIAEDGTFIAFYRTPSTCSWATRSPAS